MQEVARSSRVSSTYLTGFALAGLVAGEGTFSVTRKLPPFADGSPRLRFVFQVTMASRDRPLLEVLRSFLGFGSIHETPPRWANHQPTSTLTVASLKAHHAAVIPFADRYVLPSAKRAQFQRWREAMAVYEAAHPPRRGRSTCSAPGCDHPVRGRGLCRRHYYRATGY